MKTLLTLFFVIFSFSLICAQSASNSAGLGLFINNIDSDYGVGINAQSPYFIKKKIAISARASFQSLRYTDPFLGEDIEGYLNAQLGLIFKTLQKEHFRLYNELGLTIVSKPDDLSTTEEYDGVFTGAYVLFGFEYFYNFSGSCFLETGLHMAGARAEDLTNDPIYAQGFSLSVGVRAYL